MSLVAVEDTALIAQLNSAKGGLSPVTDERVLFELENAQPTRSFGENLKAGIGKGLTNIARGAGQRLRETLQPRFAKPNEPNVIADMLGLPSEQSIGDAAKRDAPLDATAGGAIGNVVGTAAGYAPTALLPGANTVTGAGLVGGLIGKLAPTQAGENSNVNAAVGTTLGGLLQLGGGMAVDKLRGAAASRAQAGATAQAQNATRDAALDAGRAAGYVVPPATAKPGLVSEGLESLGGKISTAQTASLKNQRVTDTLAREYLGMPPDAILSKAAIADAKNVAAEPYRQIADMSGEAKTLLDKWKQSNFDARMQWNYYRKSGNPEAYTAAKAAGDAATVALDGIEAEATKLGAQQLIPALKEARVAIAKLSTVESALNKGGHIDARVIAKQGERIKFDGALKTIADFAGNFEKAVQSPEKIGGISNALRTGIGSVGGAALGGAPGAAIGAAASVALPWTVRQALLSKAGQRAFATPSYGGGAVPKTIADLLGNRALPAAATATAINQRPQ